MAFDLSSLNPYSISYSDNSILFQTDSNVTYEIYFAEGDGYFEGYDFALFVKIFGFRQITPSQDRIHSKRIAETIVFHLLEFFDDERHIVLYVCNQSDNRQASRKRLFDNWYNYYAPDTFVKLDFDFDSTLFLSIITQKRNPYLAALQESLPKIGYQYK